MRRIVLDTETTGLEPAEGHRIIELACLELDGRRATGRHFHRFVNPGRDIDLAATQVHGMTAEDLADKPKFADIADEFLEFVDGAELLIHNAPFDVAFLDLELGFAGHMVSSATYAKLTDTLALARDMFPGKRNSLDALCERFGIDNSSRTKHGALLDSELLAEVYLELSGGRQRDLGLAPEIATQVVAGALAATGLPVRPARPHAPSAAELAAHAEFLKQISEPLWLAA